MTLENGIPLRVPCSLFGATRVELRDLPTLLLRRDINPQPRCQAMSCTNLALGCTVAHGRRGGPERVAQDQDVLLVESFGSVQLLVLSWRQRARVGKLRVAESRDQENPQKDANKAMGSYMICGVIQKGQEGVNLTKKQGKLPSKPIHSLPTESSRLQWRPMAW